VELTIVGSPKGRPAHHITLLRFSFQENHSIEASREWAKMELGLKSKIFSHCMMIVDVALRHVSHFHPQRFQKMLGQIISQIPQTTVPLHVFVCLE
jgi:hypothetical protein